jgi:hypothetical protein
MDIDNVYTEEYYMGVERRETKRETKMNATEIANLMSHLRTKITFWQGKGREDKVAEYRKELKKAEKAMDRMELELV